MVYFNSQISDSIAPYKNVRRVQFGILSSDETRRMSVTNSPIEHPELMEGGNQKNVVLWTHDKDHQIEIVSVKHVLVHILNV
jgi:hypothetical protein